MATSTGAESGPPFPLHQPGSDPWREQALSRIGEQRFILSCLQAQEGAPPIPEQAAATIRDHWEAAAAAAKARRRRGAVERVTSHLDAVDTNLLRVAPASYVYGQLPGIVARAKKCFSKDDLRLTRLQTLAQREGFLPLSEFDRNLVVAAHHATGADERRQIGRLRSFTSMLYGAAAVLALAAVLLALSAFLWPGKLPVCFSPGENVVCATSTTVLEDAGPADSPQRAAAVDAAMRARSDGWDIALVEGVGLLAAALAAATSLRNVRGTSTPFRLPLAVALLKLPTGALTAVFGLLLMRGGFVPGLSDLDTPGQIVAWAVLLGYSQQVLTRFVDQRAQTILDNFGRSRSEQEAAHMRIDPAPATV